MSKLGYCSCSLYFTSKKQWKSHKKEKHPETSKESALFVFVPADEAMKDSNGAVVLDKNKRVVSSSSAPSSANTSASSSGNTSATINSTARALAEQQQQQQQQHGEEEARVLAEQQQEEEEEDGPGGSSFSALASGDASEESDDTLDRLRDTFCDDEDTQSFISALGEVMVVSIENQRLTSVKKADNDLLELRLQANTARLVETLTKISQLHQHDLTEEIWKMKAHYILAFYHYQLRKRDDCLKHWDAQRKFSGLPKLINDKDLDATELKKFNEDFEEFNRITMNQIAKYLQGGKRTREETSWYKFVLSNFYKTNLCLSNLRLSFP